MNGKPLCQTLCQRHKGDKMTEKDAKNPSVYTFLYKPEGEKRTPIYPTVPIIGPHSCEPLK